MSVESAHVDDSEEPYRENPKFKTWRKHVRDLYQIHCHYERTWLSRTLQFLPNARIVDSCAEQNVLSGTATGCGEQNYVEITTLTLPTKSNLEMRTFDPDLGEVGGFGLAPNDIQCRVTLRMFHNGDVLRARYSPSNPNIIGTCSADGLVYIFDKTEIAQTKRPNKPERPLLPTPQEPEPDSAIGKEAQMRVHQQLADFREAMELQAQWDKQTGDSQHKLILGLDGAAFPAPCFSMDWTTSLDSSLAACSNDQLAVWSIGHLPKQSTDRKTVQSPTQLLKIGHEINDIRFHPNDQHIIGAALDKRGIGLFDLRTQKASDFKVDGIESGLSIDWCPHDMYVGALGTADGAVAIFDMRNPSRAIVRLAVHREGSEVPRLSWSPHARGILATAGEDATSCVVDIGAEKVLFCHNAHLGIVEDVQWCPHDMLAGVIGTVDSTAACFWKPRSAFWCP